MEEPDNPLRPLDDVPSADGSRGVSWWILLVTVMVPVVVVAAVVISLLVSADRDDRMRVARSRSVSVDGWSAVALACGAGSPMDLRLVDHSDDVHVVDLGSGRAAEDELVECLEIVADPDVAGMQYRDNTLVPDDHHSYFVVPTHRDRTYTRLADVEVSDDDPVRLTVQILYPGPHCAVTEEYRGSLVLLVEAPAGAEVPSVTLEDIHEPC